MKLMIIRIIISLIILYTCGYGLVAIKNVWTKELDLKKTLPNPFGFVHFKKEFLPPNPFYELRHTNENYQPGLEVYGISWEIDFLLYEFTFINKSKMTSMEDVRLKFEIPGVFVKHILIRQEGVENVTVSSENDYLRKVNPKTDTIVDTVPTRSNVFTVNISKVYPRSHASLKFIFQGEMGTDIPSYFTIKYSFTDENSGQQRKQKIHPIVVKKPGDWEIDSLNEIDGTKVTQHAFSVVPIHPVSSKIENKPQQITSSEEKNKVNIRVHQILSSMDGHSLVMIAMIFKYKPANQKELIELLAPFKFIEKQYNDSLRRLTIGSGLVWIGNPADVKRSDPVYAPLSLINDAQIDKDMYSWFKQNWTSIFKSFPDIEPDFDSKR